MIRGLVKWCFAGALSGLLFGVADGLVLALGARAMFFDTSELLCTIAATVGICAGAGVVAALVIGTIAEVLNFASLPGRVLDRRFAVTAVLTALYAAPVDLALWVLTAGPQASQLPMRPLMVGLVSFLFGAIGAITTTRTARFGARKRSHRYIVVAAAALIAAVLYVIDLTVLVRLYPAFHYGLTALAFLPMAAALRLLWLFGRWRAFNWIAVAVALIAIIGCALSMYWVRSTQNSRFVIAERTSATVDVVTAVRAIVPPAGRFDEADIEQEAAPLTAVSTGPAISRPDSPVFLISVDAMRHDRLLLGDPGDRRQVAPNLDALAAKSVVFERAYTPIPHTSYSVTSILTGKYVHRLFEVPGAPAVHETWPEILHRFRYRTGGFFTKAVVFIDRSRFEPYLRKRFGFDEAEMQYRVPAAERVRQTIDFLERARADGHDSKIFTWTHFFEPHEPYDPECTRFGAEDQDRYDCEIATVDEAVGELLGYIDAHYPEAIVIATADHGEEFGDHGGRYHGTTLYDEQVRVPLMIRVPGLEHRVVGQPVNLVDLLGTTLSMLEIPIPARMRSIDLTGLMTGRDSGPFESFCEVHSEVMIAREDHKLICDREADLCRLYDLADDPDEQRSIASTKPELVRELDSRIRAWERSHPRIELRPIVTDDKAQGWPAPIRRALAGDESAVDDVIEVIVAGAPEPVRRKGAELVAELWAEREAGALQQFDAAGDPVVSAWIAVARHRAADPEALAGTDAILPELERLSPPWRALVLARLEGGDKSAIPDACEIAADKATPHPDRWKAVDLLSRTGDRVAAETLVQLIDDYQLSQDVVAALAALRHRPAVPLLLKRLKRERFPERRTAVAVALAALGDRRAIPQLAGELAREEPAPGVMRPLLRLGAGNARGKRIRADVEGAQVTIWSPVPDGPLRPKTGTPSRLFVLTTAAADGGQVLVSCDGVEAGSAPIFAGEQTQMIEIEDCAGEIALAVEPADLGVNIEAAAIVVPD